MNRVRPYLNRFVKIKEQQIEDSYHSANLREIKPITTKLIQHGQAIIINKSKGDMIREVREIEIERENRVLLQKISSTMHKKGAYSVSKTKNIRTKVNKSLNHFYRKRQLEEIQSWNKRFVKRLQQKKPTLNIQKLQRDWLDNKDVIKRMSNQQFNLTSIKSTSRVRSNTIERFYKAKYDKIKFSKIKVIDGIRILIKVEFTEDMLKIVGDTQNQKDLKVIEVPKEEAVIFIEKDCKGKPENLIHKLKYDSKSETLYLVSDHLGEEDPDFSDFNPEVDKITVHKDEKKKSQTHNKSSIDSKNSHPKEQKQKKEEVNSSHHKEQKEISDIKHHPVPLIQEKRKRTEKKVSEEHVQEKKEKKSVEVEPTHEKTNGKQKEKESRQQYHQEIVEKKKKTELEPEYQSQPEPESQRVVQKDKEPIQPQQEGYEEQKFEESNNLAESKPKEEVGPMTGDILEPQVAQKEIVVAPEQEQNYDEDLQEGEEIKRPAVEVDQIQNI